MIKFIILRILSFFDFLYQKKIFLDLKKRGYHKFDIFFDVGAHKGESIKVFTKNFEIKKIFSFEPSKVNFQILKKNTINLKKNKKNIEYFIENLALGNEENDIILKNLEESSSSTINEINTDSKYFKRKSLFLFKKKDTNFFCEENVKQTLLKNYIEKKQIKKINFLKIDTEGFEYNVILGLREKIKLVSIIMFEHHYDNMILKGYKFSDINKYLIKNNFIKISKHKMPFRKTFEYIYINKSNDYLT